jgi:hypothetical protein
MSKSARPLTRPREARFGGARPPNKFPKPSVVQWVFGRSSGVCAATLAYIHLLHGCMLVRVFIVPCFGYRLGLEFLGRLFAFLLRQRMFIVILSEGCAGNHERNRECQ